MSSEVKRAARRTIACLCKTAQETSGLSTEGLAFDALQQQLALAQAALTAPDEPVGPCPVDGGELRFEGRSDGLYLCCAANLTHAWRVA
jgi:hypothetical protein